MSLRQRASFVLQRPSIRRVGIATAIAGAGGVALAITIGAEASAVLAEPNATDAADTADTADTHPETRLVSVTPADRMDVVAESAPVDALTTALVARYERLVAVDPAPQAGPVPREPAQFGSAGDDGAAGSDTNEQASATTNVALATWEAVARCESGYGGEPDWSINTGNGYYGGLQFNLDSWRWVGGTGYPHEASKATQIEMAERLWERQGWNAWPACSRKLGLR